MEYKLNSNVNVTKFLVDKISSTIINFSDTVRNDHTIYNIIASDSISKQLLDNIVEKQEYINNSLSEKEKEIELFAIKHNIVLSPLESADSIIEAQNVVKGRIYKIHVGGLVGNKDLTHIGATENIEGNAFICTKDYSEINPIFQSEVSGAYVRQFLYFENSNIQYDFTKYSKLTGYAVSGAFSSAMYNKLIDNENSFIQREIVINDYLEKIRNDLSDINAKIYVNGLEILNEFPNYNHGLGYGTYSVISDEGKQVSEVKNGTVTMYSSDRATISGKKYLIRMLTKGKVRIKVQSHPVGTYLINNLYDDVSYTYRELIFTANDNFVQVWFGNDSGGEIGYIDYVSCMKYYEHGLSIIEMKIDNYGGKRVIAKNNINGEFHNYNTDYFYFLTLGIVNFIYNNPVDIIVTPSKYYNYIRNNLYYNQSFNSGNYEPAFGIIGNEQFSGIPLGDQLYLYKSYDYLELPSITTDSKNKLKGLVKSELTLENICKASGLN